MREIGGFFELECGCRDIYHKNVHMLNSGRSALRTIIKSFHIDHIHVPAFTCPVVWEAIKDEGAECVFYDVDDNFLPKIDFPKNDYIIYTNYFGCCARQVRNLTSQYPDIIVDNAQAFYMPGVGFASIYSPRKFFGLPDGGLLFCKKKIDLPQKISESWGRCTHLLKRHDLGASPAYNDFKKNGVSIRDEGIALMSRLTSALMSSIDYDRCAKIRINNFKSLHRELKDYNKLNISLTDEDVPLVYPFWNEHCGLKEYLIKNKIYVATYWPGLVENLKLTEIIPLPVDQRYGEMEMKYIADVVKKYVSVR